MAASNFAGVNLVKSGYLHRRTGVLKKWKRQWFTLTDDGILRFYEGELSGTACDAARMKVDCVYIKTAEQITKATAPDTLSQSYMIEVGFQNKTWFLCAETSDDLATWKLVLEEARIVRPQAGTTVVHQSTNYGPQRTTYIQQNRSYPVQQTVHTYPGQQIVYSNPNQTVYSNYAAPTWGNGTTTVVQGGAMGPGQTTVYVNNNDPNQRRYNDGDMAMGVMAGAAMGSMMYGPVLFW